MISPNGCRICAQGAVEFLGTVLDAGEQQVRLGNVQHAIRALMHARSQLGWLDALNFACELGVHETISTFSHRASALEETVTRYCQQGRAGLSGQEIDPFDAYRKLRKPLPPQKGGVHGGKKGKKGYDRKRDKRRTGKEG